MGLIWGLFSVIIASVAQLSLGFAAVMVALWRSFFLPGD